MAGEESPADLERQSFAFRSMTIICITLLYYDFFLTFGSEVSRFWIQRRFSWVLVTFYFNRYISLAGHIPIILRTFWVAAPITSCPGFALYNGILAVVLQFNVAVVLVMRIYALYDRNFIVLIILVIIIIAALSVGTWSLIKVMDMRLNTNQARILPLDGCFTDITESAGIYFALSWSGMLVFDLMVFGMTFYKALTLPRLGDVELFSVVIRDGSLYFAVMVCSNIANIVVFLRGGTRDRGMASILTNVASSIMISRLMLNLRSPKILRSFREHISEHQLTVRGPVSTVDAASTGFTGVTDWVPRGMSEDRGNRTNGNR